MKTIKTIRIFVVSFIIGSAFFVSCNKDDNNEKTTNSNKYSYKGQDYVTDISTFFDADDNTYLFFENSDLNKVEGTNFIFANRNFDQLDGTYTYNPNAFDPDYDPSSNFNLGALTLTNGLPLNATDGTITIKKSDANKITVTYSKRSC